MTTNASKHQSGLRILQISAIQTCSIQLSRKQQQEFKWPLQISHVDFLQSVLFSKPLEESRQMIEYILLPKDYKPHLMHHQIGPEVGRMNGYLGTYGEYNETHYKDKGPKRSRLYYDMRLSIARLMLYTQDGHQEKVTYATQQFHA